MKNQKILSVSFVITIGHFFLTLAIGHYIGVQIGSRMGQVVAGGILDNINQNTEEADKGYIKIEDKSNDLLEEYKVVHIVLSLPIKFLLESSIKKIHKMNLNNAISNEITMEQFYARWHIIRYSANFINSFSLGLLIYCILWLSFRSKT